MKIRSTLFALLILPMLSWGQISLVPIQNIQNWAGLFQPDSCSDGPNPVYLNDTVKVRGVVITRGGLNETGGQTRWIWIRDVSASASTPYANISVRTLVATSPTDINRLLEGDTIEVTAVVGEFNSTGQGETQLVPVATGIAVRLISEEAGPAPQAILVNVGELNGGLNSNNQPNNNLTTGEKYEGNFVEIQNVQVVTVDLAVADRCRILVKDAGNNHIWIYDRFKTQRITNGFVPPNVGDSYTSIRGIIEGWKSGCPGGATGNRGYNLNPFSLSHYVKGASSPAIGKFKKSVGCPGPADAVTISADVTDDGSVVGVDLFYSVNGTIYTRVAATVIGTKYSAQIPPQPNDTLVRYYFRARDNLNNTTAQPNVPALIPPMFYAVNSNGCTVKDIQFTPYINGRSGYVGDTLTVQGIVTASADPTNLGFVYIQQEGETAWSGIWVNGGSIIAGLNVGERVSITGTVEEYFGLTRLSNISNAAVVSTGLPAPEPLVLDPSVFSTYSFATSEQYEGMFVKLENPASGQSLFVVDTNADAASGRNNGEYRIGADINDPNSGTRILAGRQNTNTFSSLNVSYVNSGRWRTEDGIMNVPFALVLPEALVSKVQGMMTYSFQNMKLLPRNNNDITIVVSNKGLLTEKEMVLFPNPASNKVNLNFRQPVSSIIELINGQGKMVSKTFSEGMESEINVKGLGSGIYRVRVIDKSGVMLAIRNLIISK